MFSHDLQCSRTKSGIWVKIKEEGRSNNDWEIGRW